MRATYHLVQVGRIHEELGIRYESQHGWFHRTIWTPMDPELEARVFAATGNDLNDYQCERWQALMAASPANRTYAQLFYWLETRLRYNELNAPFALLIPAWCAVDRDECITCFSLWMAHKASALWEEASIIRPWWVAAILVSKVPSMVPFADWLWYSASNFDHIGHADRTLADYWETGKAGLMFRDMDDVRFWPPVDTRALTAGSLQGFWPPVDTRALTVEMQRLWSFLKPDDIE
jgi:hypothetical protein